MKGQLWRQYMLTYCWQLYRYKTGTLNFMKFCKVNLELSHLLSLEVLKKSRSLKKTFILICKGCVRYLNRCKTSPMYIYQLKVNKKMSLPSLTISSLTTHHILYINHNVFMKFTMEKLRQASFQIMWHIGMPKQIPLQESKYLFRWNRQPGKKLDWP